MSSPGLRKFNMCTLSFSFLKHFFRMCQKCYSIPVRMAQSTAKVSRLVMIEIGIYHSQTITFTKTRGE